MLLAVLAVLLAMVKGEGRIIRGEEGRSRGQDGRSRRGEEMSRGPPVASQGQEVVVAQPYREARLVCPIRGNPQPFMEWQKVSLKLDYVVQARHLINCTIFVCQHFVQYYNCFTTVQGVFVYLLVPSQKAPYIGRGTGTYP